MTATCPRCGDEVGAAGCPTCGDGAPGDGGAGSTELLLARVREALEEHARRARRGRAGDGPEHRSPLVARLRRQAALLTDVLADQEQVTASLRDALGRLERALDASAPPASTLRSPVIDVALPRTDGCAELARRHVTRHTAELLDEQTVGDALLIASELVNNAYVHGTGQITLRLLAVGDRLRIEVADEGRPTWIGARAEVDGGTGGWGLWIVERLSLAWGAEELSARVWAEVPLRGSSARAVGPLQLDAER